MGTVGDAYDNAMAESFFASLGYLSPLNFERNNETLFDVVEDAVVHVQTTPETV